MRIGFQIDPFDRLNPAADSSLALAREAHRRGYETFSFQPSALTRHEQGLCAYGRWFTSHKEGVCQGPLVREDLGTLDVVWMRQDPPVDMAYLTATFLLETLCPNVVVLNDPRAVRNTPEKGWVLDWPQWIPATCISSHVPEMVAFHAQQGHVVCKPLWGHAGHDVVQFLADETEAFRAHVERGARAGVTFVVQPFLPGVVEGDKRVLMLEGEILGVFQRVPPANDFRANLRVGAVAHPTLLTAREKKILDDVGCGLRARGLFLAGIDLIQEHLIEINVTSPTGLVTLNELYGGLSEARVWDAVEARCHAHASAPRTRQELD